MTGDVGAGVVGGVVGSGAGSRADTAQTINEWVGVQWEIAGLEPLHRSKRQSNEEGEAGVHSNGRSSREDGPMRAGTAWQCDGPLDVQWLVPAGCAGHAGAVTAVTYGAAFAGVAVLMWAVLRRGGA